MQRKRRRRVTNRHKSIHTSVAQNAYSGIVNLMKCAKCGYENAADNVFCNMCGTKLGENASQTAPPTQSAVGVDENVRGVIVKRFDAIKNKDEATVTGLMDESYSKFDDWAPYQRQERSEALQNEFSAFKVLSNYTYELNNLKTSILGGLAIATCIVHYKANIRNQQYDITSRVTIILKGQDSTWKIVHEHFSRIPQEGASQQQFQRQRRFGFPF